jgi:hypothetical protein
MSCGIFVGAGVGVNAAYEGIVEGITVGSKLAEDSADGI